MKALLRTIGFFLSLFLTLLAFGIIVRPQFFGLSNSTAILLILLLALSQSIVQLIFFLDVWKEQGPRWNLGVFLSTVSIIFIVIFFSLWIISSLEYYNMGHAKYFNL